MLPAYNRYLMKHLALPVILITGALTCIIWLIQALRFIDFIVNRGLSIGDFIHITSLLFPSLLLLLVPISVFVAVLYTYNRLQADSELVVMRASGLSRWQLALPAFQVAAMAMLFCYMISIFLMPMANRQFNDMRQFLQNNYASILLQEEVFNHPVDRLTVFIRERDSDGNLHGILVHDARTENVITMMAEHGRLSEGPNGPSFALEKGMRQELRNGRVSWLNFDSYSLDISFYTQSNLRKRDPDEKYLPELFDESLEGKRRASHRAEAHQRLTWPIYNLVLTGIALAMLLSGSFNRRGNGKRIMAACAMTVAMVVIAISLRNAVAKNAMLVPLMYLVLTMAAGAIVYLLSANRLRKPPINQQQSEATV